MNIQSDLIIPFSIPKSRWELKPFDSLFLIGSCFSENMYQRLQSRKFDVYSNPYGILFDTLAVETALREIIHQKKYEESDLFYFNELWNSWNHHGKFSSISAQKTLEMINNEIVVSYNKLLKSKVIVITLGTSFSYYHLENNIPVANCHKVPQTSFEKRLIEIDEIKVRLQSILDLIYGLNPSVQIIFTISPVRHLRDGVMENNRSKARLIEAVHDLVSKNEQVHYFPAYEIVIDVLRDYRYYDIDYAHPNTLATNIVFDYFMNWCVSEENQLILDKLYTLQLAKNHKPIHPETLAHKKFLKANHKLALHFQEKYPEIDFSEEIKAFNF